MGLDGISAFGPALTFGLAGSPTEAQPEALRVVQRAQLREAEALSEAQQAVIDDLARQYAEKVAEEEELKAQRRYARERGDWIEVAKLTVRIWSVQMELLILWFDHRNALGDRIDTALSPRLDVLA